MKDLLTNKDGHGMENNSKKYILCVLFIQSMINLFIIKISYTPNDCALLWEEIESVFEDHIDMDGYSPDEYFSKKLISLNDCKQYELFLKDKIN